MSDVLYHPTVTATQRAAQEQRQRLWAKPPVVIPIQTERDPEIEQLKSKLEVAEIELKQIKTELSDQATDLGEVKILFKKLFGGHERIKTIQKAVAAAYGVTRQNIIAARREDEIVKPRHVAMYLAKELTGLSLPIIGRHFGGRDHTTVLHAYRKIAELIKTDSELAGVVAGLIEKIGRDA